MNGRLKRYVTKQIDSVSGYLNAIDATTITLLGQYQIDHDIGGSLCEMGVHHGKLFFILALLRQSDQKSLAIDLFEDGTENPQAVHRGRDTAFFRHRERFGIALGEDELIKGDTRLLKPEDILSRIGKARMISVDAGHLYDEVANDLALAGQVTADNGVIIADDYFNTVWPDVTGATNAFIDSSGWRPFLITPGKLYLCRPQYFATYDAFVKSVEGRKKISTRQVQFNKLPLTQWRMSPRRQFLWDRLAIGRL
jgi:hypothetical protein